ncbi:MAG: chemotaxis protein CheW [Actinomycetota bacterium]|nr:chemotaxis protein CheW [Actinomycetota bacterium]
MDEMDEILGEFLVESHENLDQLDRDLVALEQEPGSRALLGSIFRTIHTIKGTSGFLGFGALESVTHVGENLLSKLRDGEIVLTQEIAGVLLELVDAVRSILEAIEASGEEGSPDHADLIARLTALQSGSLAAAAPAVTAGAPVVATAPAAQPVTIPSQNVPVTEPVPAPEAAVPAAAQPAPAVPGAPASIVPASEQPAAVEPVVVPEPAAAEPAAPLGELLVEKGVVQPEDVSVALMEQQVASDGRPLGQILVEHGKASKEDVGDALESQAAVKRSVADSTIRVDVDLLDSLMRLVGELVLTRNQIVQHAGGMGDQNLTRASQRLNLIASELQEGVMKTRMQPIDHVWSKLTRVVRDLGVSLGKSVKLEMQGRDTELDKTILEAVKDPLTHLVRNAVDHGIESPEERVRAGKTPEGTLLLRAYHEGGQVIVEITDDGGGINPKKIAAKALERGLVSADELARMSEREMTSMIFLPGFSTAAKVTNVSGRGVGMDVVKTNIEKIGGTVDVQSTHGEGSTFRIKIPLTLAIIPALTVKCAGDRYAIPQVSLVELVRLEGEDASKGIEQISGAPVLRLRGSLLPLVHLDNELGLAAERSDEQRATFIVVLQAEDRQFGLVVDEVLDTEEIVVKPLSQQLKGMGVYAGATILGDGRVALILDALAVAQQAHVVNAARDRAMAERLSELDGMASSTESLLVVGLEDGRRMAVPLATVTRLEEFPLTQIERVGSRQVVQYRGQILPLVNLSSYLGSGGFGDPQESLQVVVYSERGRSVGLVVDRILDIAEEVLAAKSDLDDHGLLGSAVVQNKITEMLDVRQAILGADPYFYSARELEESGVPA